MLVKILLITLLFLVSHAYASGISTTDRAFFLDDSYSQYSEKVKGVTNAKQLLSTKELEAEDVLYGAFKFGKSDAEALNLFADYYRLNKVSAELSAQEIIASFKVNAGCLGPPQEKRCRNFKLNLENIEKIKFLPVADEILYTILVNTHSNPDIFNSILKIVGPNRAVLERAFIYSGDFAVLVPLVSGIDTPSSVLALVSLCTRCNTLHIYDRIALNEFILDKGEEFSERTAIENKHIAALFVAGLDSKATVQFEKIINGDLIWYVKKGENVFNCNGCDEIVNSLIAHYIAINDMKSAKQLAAIVPIKKLDVNKSQYETRQFLENVLFNNVDQNQLYYWMIYGAAKGGKTTFTRYDADQLGWIGSLSSAAPIVKQIAVKYLQDPKFSEFARYLKGNMYQEERIELPIKEKLGKSFQEIADKYQNAIAMAASPWVLDAPAQKQQQPNYRVLSNLIELDLPKAYRNKRPINPNLNKLPNKPPVDESSIVKLEQYKKEWFLIYVSSAIDPTGEIPAPGYWFMKTTRDGLVWGVPVYMGMQVYFPYEITRNSAMPMMSENGIDVQASIKELDTNSITFPPTGLSFKREVHNRLLHFDLNDLYKDSDEDGLTDILEAKIGTNPHAVDTDNDGQEDGADTLPLTPFDKNAIQFNKLASLLLKKIKGVDELAITVGVGNNGGDLIAAAGLDPNIQRADRSISAENTLFLTGNIDLFKGLNIPIRLIFVGDNTLNPTGFFLPTDIGWVFQNDDKSEYFVIWSSGWAGGSFVVHVKNGEFEVEEVSSWIT